MSIRVRHPALLPALLLALLFSLASCSLTPRTATKPVTDWQRFAEHQQQLRHWQLTGKLAVRLPTDSPPGMRISWRQQQQQFSLRLSGLLGIGTTYIEGDRQQVTLRSGKQQHTANNSEELTAQLFGLPLSMADLTYWVRGIPAPEKPVTARLHNDNGALQTLSQDGWQLAFSRYKETDNWLLPGKITGQRGELSFKLIIKKWQPEAAD